VSDLTTGWQARVLDDMADFSRDHRRLVIWRRYGDRVELVTGFTEDGTAIVTDVGPEGPEFRGFDLPWEAFDAIGEAIVPGPSKAEVARIEEALTVERKRVDQALDRLIPGDRP